MTTYSNYPTATPTPSSGEKKDNRNTIYIILITALLGTWGYIIYDKKNTTQTINSKNTEISKLDSIRNDLQDKYQATLSDLDTKTTENAKLDSVVKSRENEVSVLKRKIGSILTKKNATESELAQAKSMIKELNSKIDGYIQQVEQLKGENAKLTAEKEQVTQERDDARTNLSNTQKAKEDLEALGSVLHASNIRMIPMQVKGSGKEKETTTAKRANLMRVMFDLDENRIAKTGEKQLVICMTGPDGKNVFDETLGSGKFTTAEGTELNYTTKVTVNYITNQRQNVSFDWKQPEKYVPGTYKINIYHNGYKIGEGSVSLKKGGLFS